MVLGRQTNASALQINVGIQYMKTRSKRHSKRKTRKGGADALSLLIGTSILYGVFGGIANAVKSRYNSEQSDTPSDTMPSDPMPSDTMPSEPMPSDTMPSDTMPSDAMYSDAMPSDAMYSDAPSDTMPSDAMPSDTMPSDTMPSDTPSDTMPSDTPSDTPSEVKKGGRRTRRR